MQKGKRISKISVNWGNVIGLSMLIGVLLIFTLFFHYMKGEDIGVTLVVAVIFLVVGMCAAFIHNFPGGYYEEIKRTKE